MNPIRLAIADTGSASREVTPVLPVNYWVLGRTLDNTGTVIAGRDEGGQTLELVMHVLSLSNISAREQHMIAPTPEQQLLEELENAELLASEMIQDAQDKCEDYLLKKHGTTDIAVPEDAAPELDNARDLIRQAIELLQEK